MRISPPESVEALLSRAEKLSGRSLAWVAAESGAELPPDLKRHKGWVGQLFEWVLGASAGSKAEPDFPHLGVELKTLPLDDRAVPRESTYVCVARMDGAAGTTWEESWCYRKLRNVIWVPIIGECELSERMVGSAFLWSPSPEEDAQLKADWEELMGLLALGELWQVSARRGRVLQLRPKAANSRDLTWVQDEDGEWVQTSPQGFYLRARFTRELIQRQFPLG